MTSDQSALVRKLNSFILLSPTELAAVADLEASGRAMPAGTDLVFEHQIGHRAFVLQRGWAFSHKLLPDGGRQIIDLWVPGDIMGLCSVLLRTSDQAISAATDITAAELTAKKLTAIFSSIPRLGTAILWAASRDQAINVEHLADLRRRPALERTAHLMLELGLRLQLVGLADLSGFACPLNQYILEDALGLTAIHLHRVLRELRERELLIFRAGHVEFLDLRKVQELVGYDSSYLDQNGV